MNAEVFNSMLSSAEFVGKSPAGFDVFYHEPSDSCIKVGTRKVVHYTDRHSRADNLPCRFLVEKTYLIGEGLVSRQAQGEK